MSYYGAMTTAGLRELRQDASSLVRRVEAGERITVTVQGRAVAELVPITPRPIWRPLDELEELFAGPADEAWADDRGEFDDDLRDPFDA